MALTRRGSGVRTPHHPPIRGAVVQSVRIPACHAGGRGFESRPLRHFYRIGNLRLYPITCWVVSSAGRASPLQGEGRGFEPLTTPLRGAVVQSVRIPACHAGGRGFESRPLRHFFPSFCGFFLFWFSFYCFPSFRLLSGAICYPSSADPALTNPLSLSCSPGARRCHP